VKRAAFLLLAASCSAGCSQKQHRLECTVQEQSGRTLRILAALSDPQPLDGGATRDLDGQTEYYEGTQFVQVPTHGVYLEATGGRELELLTFGERPNRLGKLNIAVQPEHPVLRQRGTKAVVLTGHQTVQDGIPAIVNCRTVGPS
jgi:hypothetical protein